jgi:hypothetical protein
VLETGVGALPTVAKLIRGVTVSCKNQEFCPCGWPGMAGLFRGPDCVRRSTGRVRPAVFYRSKFEVSAALLQLGLCTACQVGPDHEVMKRPDRVEIGEAQGIVGMHNGCRDEQRA